MKLDAHQHFWRYDKTQYPWIPSGSPLHRDWLPDDLAPLLEAEGLEGCIAVQARQSVDESRWLLELADRHPIVKGVVGWVDLRADDVERDLERFAAHSKFVGVRHVVQDEPDVNFMLREAFLRGIAKLQAYALTYDILIFPQQLPAAIELARCFPEQSFVVDHIAKPQIKAGLLEPWSQDIRELAASPNVSCKISGLVTEADHTHWRPDDFRPYLDSVVEAFGEDRIMYGSDWPVCLLAASYPQTFGLADEYSQAWTAEQRAKFFGGNAGRFYGIE